MNSEHFTLALSQNLVYLAKNTHMFTRLRYILLFIGLLSNFVAKPQAFTEPKRAEYIFYVIERIKWLDTITSANFVIGIAGKEDELYTALIDQAKLKPQLQGKSVKIVQFKKIDDIKDVNVIFSNNRSGFNINQIYTKVAGKSVLIIGEDYEFESAMVGFVEVEGKRKYTVNEKMLAQEKLEPNKLFLALAIKSREQWMDEFRKQREQMEEEIDKLREARRKIHAQRDTISQQQKAIDAQTLMLKQLEENISKTQANLEVKLSQLAEQEKNINNQRRVLAKQNEDINQQKGMIVEQKKVLNEQLAKIKLQQLVLWLAVVFILLAISLVFFIYRSYRIKKESNRQLQEKNYTIEQRNMEIMQQKEEIEAQRDEIEVQRDFVMKQNQEISQQKHEIQQSIQYARRIQLAVLPPDEVLSAIAPNHFTLNLPRDIVSGDYYWATQRPDYNILVVADCTGHGVPGATMSMLGVSFLNEIMTRHENIEAGQVLDELRRLVIKALHQTGKENEQKDGMDISLCIIFHKERKLQFAGANNPLYMVRKFTEGYPLPDDEKNKLSDYTNEQGELYQLAQITADKMPIGIYLKLTPFTTNTIHYLPGDTFYMSSDGYSDQFGGATGTKFMSKKFKQLLLTIQQEPMDRQQQILHESHIKWKGTEEQVDDVMVMGFRID